MSAFGRNKPLPSPRISPERFVEAMASAAQFVDATSGWFDAAAFRGYGALLGYENDQDRHPIDIAFLPIGDHYTMGPDDALEAAKWFGAKLVVPSTTISSLAPGGKFEYAKGK